MPQWVLTLENNSTFLTTIPLLFHLALGNNLILILADPFGALLSLRCSPWRKCQSRLDLSILDQVHLSVVPLFKSLCTRFSLKLNRKSKIHLPLSKFWSLSNSKPLASSMRDFAVLKKDVFIFLRVQSAGLGERGTSTVIPFLLGEVMMWAKPILGAGLLPLFGSMFMTIIFQDHAMWCISLMCDVKVESVVVELMV